MPMQPKILAIIAYFYPFKGGAERQALLLCQSLKSRGFSACVLTRYFPGLQSFEAVHGVPVYRSIHTLPWSKLFGISYFLSCLWFLVRKRHTYDIIHCYILQGFHCLAAIVMKYLFGKKVIIRVSATGPLSDFLLLQQGLGGGFFLRCVRKADTIITLCRQSYREALAAGFRQEHIVSVPNGVDTAAFSPAQQPAAPGHILFVGRLDEMKGVALLLKAIKELRQSGIGSFCTIVGDGPIREDLQNYAKELAIDDLVVFPGACSAIVSYLHQASIFVLPSLSEGVPNAILEAMACGLPVIATAVGGVPDIIQDGRNGILVPPADSQALSAALAALLKNRNLAAHLGRQARRDAEDLFSMDKVAERYLSLYKSMTAQN